MNWLDKLRIRVVDELRGVIEGWAMVFTGPDRRDGHGTYFDDKTDYALDAYERRPSYWHHGLRTSSFGQEVIGYAPTLELRSSDGVEGIWARVDLRQDHPHLADMLRRIQEEPVAFSTGVVPGKYEFAEDGRALRWHIAEVSPSEKASVLRGSTVGALRAALGIEEQIDGLPDFVPLERRFVLQVPGPVEQVQQPVAQGGVASPPPVRSGAGLRAGEGVPLEASQPVRNLFAGGARVPSSGQIIGADGLRADRIEVHDPLDDWEADDLLYYLTMTQQANRVPHLPRSRAITGQMLRAAHDKVMQEVSDDLQQERALRCFDDEDRATLRAHGGQLLRYQELRADEVNNIAVTGFGDDFVPTAFSAMAWRNFRKASTVLALFDEVVFSASPATWPTVGAGPTIRKGIELEDQANVDLAAAVWPSSKIATDIKTFVAGELVALTIWSERLQMFAGVDLVSEYRRSFEEGMADGIDYALVNGDETASVSNMGHLGTDPTGTAYDSILILDGLRHQCLAGGAANGNVTDNAAGALAIEDFNTIRFLMSGGKSLDVGNLVFLADEAFVQKAIGLSDVTTLEKYGQMATLLTGELGRVWGIPLTWSSEMEGTNGDGQVEDSHDSTGKSCLCIHRSSVKVGRFKNVEIKTAPIFWGSGSWMSANVFIDLQFMDADAVAYGFDFT